MSKLAMKSTSQPLEKNRKICFNTYIQFKKEVCLLHKKIKILIILLFIFIILSFFQISFAKYVIESSNLVAKINIDITKPKLELLDITCSNTNYPTYANRTHLITGHIKITERNIIRNNFTSDTLKVFVNDSPISIDFKKFSLISDNSAEKIYEFSFTNVTGNGFLSLFLPEKIIEDSAGFCNDSITFSTSIIIDNTAPTVSFEEILSDNGKSTAQLTSNESLASLPGWVSSDNILLFKEFFNPVSYLLPITDFAQNSSEVLVNIKNATNISLNYGTFDVTSKQTFVSNGQISAPNTISSNSVSKIESLSINLFGDIVPQSLQGRVYIHTYWGDGASETCLYDKNIYYYHGFNPPFNSTWLSIGSDNIHTYPNNVSFSQFGGAGMNRTGRASSLSKPLPSDIAKQYLFGISGMQFKLNNSPDLSIVYQGYVKDFGWLTASSDGEENLYQHDKPFSSIRMNLIPKTEKQHLINFWNRDIGTHNVN